MKKLRALVRSFLAAAGFMAAAGVAIGAPVELLPVANVTIYPGDIIVDSMITDGRFPVGTMAAFPVAVSRGELAGKVARRTLLPGRLIARNSVSEPELVKKGTIVAAVYQSGEVTITASVVALEAGSLDEAIQVRNVDSGKIILGSVQADGSIRIASE